MHRQVTGAGRVVRVVCLGYRVGVEGVHVRGIEQLNVAPPVEVRRERQRVTEGTQGDRRKLRPVTRQAGGVVVLVLDAEDRETLLARRDAEGGDVALDAHAERGVAA